MKQTREEAQTRHFNGSGGPNGTELSLSHKVEIADRGSG